MSTMYDLPQEEKKSGFEIFIGVIGAIGSFLFSSIEAIISAVAISVVLYLFLFTPHEVVGSSMHPTYVNGEYLLANKVVYRIKEHHRGDVIIFEYSQNKDYIKRIIGIPGDSISIRDGSIYVNGDRLNESDYLTNSVRTEGASFLAEGETVIVPEDHLFVVGDNRGNSSDSRAFGFIQFSQVKGKAWVVYFPFSEFRLVKAPQY